MSVRPRPAKSHDLSDIGMGTMLRQRFFDLALDHPVARQVSGWTDAAAVQLIEGFVAGMSVSRATTRGGRFHTWLATRPGTKEHAGTDRLHLYVDLDSDGEWEIMVAAYDAATMDECVTRFERLMPERDTSGDTNAIWVNFWAMGAMGPINYYRRLDASSWGDVEVNYPAAVTSPLGRLMRLEQGPDGGRLVLWHGPPGTGKTHAIRALANAWSPWCDVDYITDADAFFEYASYMIGTLVMGEDPAGERWRLVVIEDAGEYLQSDAAAKTGQGLSRLLNLTDGLVGQGLRLLVLMTTNEPISSLHAAVTRPGRCLSQIEFGRFEATEGQAWLERRGLGGELEEDATLAELYEMVKPLRVEAALARLRAVD